jgi:hypothetical protein
VSIISRVVVFRSEVISTGPALFEAGPERSFFYSFMMFSTCSCWPPSWEMAAPQSLHAMRS